MRCPISSTIGFVIIVAACGEPTTPAHLLEPSAAVAAKTKGPPPPPTPNVTSTVFDADAAGNPLLTRSDDVNGSGFATYTATGGVTSAIAGDGSWELFLGTQSARRLFLVLQSQGIPAPDGLYWKNVEVNATCYNANDDQVNIVLMVAGAVNENCAFGVTFLAGSTKYRLVMAPKFAGTGRAMVTCNSAANGFCTGWTITTDASVANAGVADLFTFDKRGNLVPDGVFRDSFLAVLTE